MFKFVVFAALVAVAIAVAPSPDDVHAEVKESKSDVRADGFDYSLLTSNSINTQASGDVHGNHKGSYEYVSPEGEHVRVEYIADENGYQPKSDLLPTPPPIPEAILKSIEYLRTHVAKDEKH